MKTLCKIVILTIATCVFVVAAFCQTESTNTGSEPNTQASSPNTYYQGTIDGKNDAQGNILYGFGGFTIGVLGVVAAAASKPEPSPFVVNSLLETKGAAYVFGYTTAYTQDSKKKNINYACIGWGVGSVLGILLIAPSFRSSESYDKNPVRLGVSIPLGNHASGY